MTKLKNILDLLDDKDCIEKIIEVEKDEETRKNYLKIKDEINNKIWEILQEEDDVF